MNGPGPEKWRGADLVSFDFLLGPCAGVVKRVAGVGGGSRSSRTFFFIFVTSMRKKCSKTLAIMTKVCQSKPNVSWHRGLAESELSRSISCLPLSRFGITEGHGLGGGERTFAERGCA